MIVMYGDHVGWGWLMIVVPLLWIGFTAAIVWAAVRIAGRPPGPAPRETPQEILDRRLSSGEIDLDTYTSVKSHLSSSATSPG